MNLYYDENQKLVTDPSESVLFVVVSTDADDSGIDFATAYVPVLGVAVVVTEQVRANTKLNQQILEDYFGIRDAKGA